MERRRRRKWRNDGANARVRTRMQFSGVGPIVRTQSTADTIDGDGRSRLRSLFGIGLSVVSGVEPRWGFEQALCGEFHDKPDHCSNQNDHRFRYFFKTQKYDCGCNCNEYGDDIVKLSLR